MKLVCLFLLISLGLLVSCSSDNDDNPGIEGPQIEWISGGTSTTYTYSGGVVSGYNFYRSFVVSEESGEVSIEVVVAGKSNTKITATFSVENGREYKLKVKGTRDGSEAANPGSDCLKVVFSSPNCTKTTEIKVDTYFVTTGIGDSYYCPTSLSFGELTIEEQP